MLKVGIEYMAISFKDSQKVGLNLGEDVYPLDVCGKKKCSGWGGTELRLRVQYSELIRRAVAWLVCYEMSIFAKDIP